jgi:hypothetical protein
LLDAELAVLENKFALATKRYEEAIRLSARRGWTNDRALAHERFGEFCLSHGASDNAEYHLTEAIRLYEDWGFMKKTHQLRTAYRQLLSPPSEIDLPGKD